MSNKKSKKRLSSNAKWGIALVSEILILVIMVMVYLSVTINQKLDKIEHVELNSQEIDQSINEGSNEAQKGYKTIALFGIDSRDKYSMGEGNRSDSIMIASINNETHDVKIVSVYRDSLLDVENNGSDLTTKVTHAYAYGGPELAIKTLNSNLDLQITEFVTVNFLALTMAIDDLGGVEIDVREDELPMLNACISEQINITGIYSDGVFDTGTLLLNGTQATGWARIRSTDQGDITRTERQRTVISKMISKAKKSDVATLNNILDDVFENVSTNVTKDELVDIIKELNKYKLGETAGFPFAYVAADLGSKGSVLVPANLTANVSALHKFLFGTENYQPTSSVTRISDMIQAETGIGEQPINVNTLNLDE